jgi:hypothetical protein
MGWLWFSDEQGITIPARTLMMKYSQKTTTSTRSPTKTHTKTSPDAAISTNE